jgi:hypothetical protein
MSLSTLCLISSISLIRNVDTVDTHYRCDLDSHADTSCVGKVFVMLGDPVRHANVSGYSRDLPSIKDVPVGTASAVWTSVKTGQLYLIDVHEFVYMPNRINHSLFCPN